MPTEVATDITLNKLPEPVMQVLGNRMTQAIQEHIFTGASLAIFHYDSPILNVAWGWGDFNNHEIEAKTSILYDLGTLTRIFTTIALLSQISDESIYLHSPITSVLPSFSTVNPRPVEGGQDPETRKMIRSADSIAGKDVDATTVSCFHLLTHTSGLPAWRDLFTANPPPPEPPATDSLSRQDRWQQASTVLYSYPFANVPEMGVIDSDTGYLVMGALVEAIEGDQSGLDQIIAKRVLGDRFTRTMFNPLSNNIKRDEIAPSDPKNTWRNRQLWGEVYDDNASSIGGIAGHAGLFSTAFEVALSGNIWLNHATKLLKIDPELAGAAVELQAQTGSDLYGLGWALKPPVQATIGDRFSAQSYGQNSDTGASLWIDPKEKLVVALLTNHSYSDAERIAYYDLRRDVHNIIIDFVQH